MKYASLGVGLALLASCQTGGDPLEGLAAASTEDRGPRIVFDLFAKPLPEMPFPNDVGTRPDPTSPTGRRVNVSTEVATRFERRVRRLVNTLDGFGTYSPITVRFDGRVDVVDLHARQNNDDPTDDALYVVAVDPDSPHFGEVVPLDVGSGRFPLAVASTDMYLLNDPRSTSSNLLLETEEEDVNGNGVLDPGEDTDDDGVLDHPNTWGTVLGDPSRHDLYDDLVSFYELESETLFVRPVLPLHEQTTYAVVLTRRLVGKADGSPIRSPFPSINHTQQTTALEPLVSGGVLADLGLTLADVAFTWSFTTQSVKADLEALRAGLYGQGTFAWMAREFPAEVASVLPVEEEGRPTGVYRLDSSRIVELFEDDAFADAAGLDGGLRDFVVPLVEQFLDYHVMFRFQSPAFIENDDGTFRVDRVTGRAEVQPGDVYMLCGVPKARDGVQAPFRVAFFMHGHGSSKFDALLWSLVAARSGVAICGIDAYGHGLLDNDFVRALINQSFGPLGLVPFGDALLTGRARDLNADGFTDSGGDYWSHDAFHTRDVVRQTAVDLYQAVRVLRHFGRGTMPVDIDGDGKAEIMGDFDADGVADLGGEQAYYMTGGSLGGIVSMVVGSSEPAFRAVAPVVGGAGLFDIAMRTSLSGPVNTVWGYLFGPMITARPSANDPSRIDIVQDVIDVMENASQATGRGVRFAQIPDPTQGLSEALQVGDRVRLTNLETGEHSDGTVRGLTLGQLFRVAVRSDQGDRLRLELFRAGMSEPYRVIDTWQREALYQGVEHKRDMPLTAVQMGWGFRRGSPDLRRMTGIAQMILDPGDPANYARYYAEPYDIRPEGRVAKPLLVVSTNGDTGVPVSAGTAFARIAGAIDAWNVDPRYGVSEDRYLIDTYNVEGLSRLRRFAADPCHYDDRDVLFDVDDHSAGADPAQGPAPSKIVRAPECLVSGVQPSYCEATCAPRPPLRATHAVNGVLLAARYIYAEPGGRHGFGVAKPGAAFDHGQFAANQLITFLAEEGAQVRDDACQATSSCDYMAPLASP